ncbi:HAMP domain-containing protein [Colwellia sp. BRX10-3]|uniref:ATP-binding protein n=1 Tax=Colwellia sp. BRX10-3 TaxID=2759844 RepID=UPI0015F62CBC|nr:ATP-binding protein [Colwellia sp. BRX10-3]MBA6391050.1 HAMP domain-containing protein [Colwellia sp. BRX10-3]
MLRVTGKFSSIGAKLFICFWLIVILTIGATRLVSEQFRTKSFIAPTHHADMAKIERISRQIKRNPATSVQKVLSMLPKREGRELLLKNVTTNEVLASEKWQIVSLQKFLTENNLESLTTVKFEFYRMTGPLAINVAGTPYQLFLASRDRKPPFGSIIHRIPTWLRLAIPVIISSILLWLLTRSLTKPLIAMQKAAARFGDGEFTARIPLIAQRNDEIGACAVSFNLMAEKLEQNIGSHQRLMADVSHELRSPMTRLQIALGLAQQNNISEDLLHKHLQRCELEVARLDEMISNVLSLSRMENTISQMELMTVDLKQLLTLCIEDAQYIANEKSITIAFEYPETALLQADANLLSSAINNILINAIKYSHKNQQVKVYLIKTNSHFVINIMDTGSGVPANDLPKLFEAFYRVAQSRERTTGGTGLGMAIAKQAIVAHNGNISAQNNSENGLTVTIELPLEISKNSVNES